MTLFRHILWLILFFLLVIQIGSVSLVAWHHQNTIKNSNQHLASITAQALLNTISLKSGQNERIEFSEIKQYLNPLVETGQFSEITVIADGEIQVKRSLPLIIDAVPDWFSQQLASHSKPVILSAFSNKIEYTVIVQTNDALADYQLYRTLKNAVQWLLIGMLVTGIALYYALKNLLRPLEHLESYAMAIGRRQFDFTMPPPRTRELGRVTSALDRMSRKLAEIFQEQLEIIQHSRTLAFEDSLTGMPNGVAFENFIKSLAMVENESGSGFIVLCKLQGLADQNQQLGKKQTDKQIESFARLWQELWSNTHTNIFTARRNNSEFATWIETDHYSRLQRAIHTIFEEFQAGKNTATFGQSLQLTFSTHYLDTHAMPNDWNLIWQKLDENMRHAISTNSLSVGSDLRTPTPSSEPNGILCSGTLCLIADQWNQILTRAITEKNIVLVFQPIMFLETETTLPFAECFMRLPHEQLLLTGAEIWPVIHQLDLAFAFDKLIVYLTLIHLNEHPKQKLSLNISETTLHSPQFCDWMANTLKHYPDLVDGLFIEVRESFLDTPDALKRLVALKSIGLSIILDRVIAQKCTVDLFVRLPISAIKINIQFLRRSYASLENSQTERDCAQASHQHLFLANLLSLCRSCDVTIIADGVETAKDLEIARTLRINAVQGYYIASPLGSCAEVASWHKEHLPANQKRA